MTISMKEQRRLVPEASSGSLRRKEATLKATEVLPQMLDSILKYLSGTFRYVLCDSWFTWPSVVKNIVNHNLHFIGMLKDNNNAVFEYQGRWYRLSTLHAAAKPQNASIIEQTIIFSIIVKYAGIPSKVVFVRNRKCQKGKKAKREWLAILSTDLTISDEEIIRIYGTRWDIEVYFKICKSYLKLGKEIQTSCYDGMVAHTTIVCVRYIMLSVQARECKDDRSCGGLFYLCCNEVENISFTQGFMLLLDILANLLRQELFLSDEQIGMFLDKLIHEIPHSIKRRLVDTSMDSV